MRSVIEEAGLTHAIEVDSAGTAAYHEGEPPDRRSARAALRRGVTLSGRARQFRTEDWQRFDYVVAMDSSNHQDLFGQARTVEHKSKLYLLRQFDANSPKGASVPDPYYGGEEAFDHVVDLCFEACRGLAAHIQRANKIDRS
jgi:protein-tyrosine phosphatase